LPPCFAGFIGISVIRSPKLVARRGETPGWDIEYTDSSGELIGVEVKGTILSKFSSVELTANEWLAASRVRKQFHLYLVARALSKDPFISAVVDPFEKSEDGVFGAEATGWRLYAHEPDLLSDRCDEI
jgi:hypothetical protein